jgi:hypothetical protein
MTVPALIPVLLGILSLYLGFKAYRRKTGAYVRGVFTPCHSRDCNDVFISELILENLKDRAVTIFGIYLRLGYNNYVELEDFEETPLILKPYETYRKAFGPIEFYAVNQSKIDLNELLSNRKTKKSLFLSTSDGKYKVRSRIRRWNPLYDHFRNYFTAVIRPVRSMYKEQSVGANMKFVVDFVKGDGSTETVPIHPRDHGLRLFKDFVLTEESLVDKESLEQFLRKQQEVGKLACKDVVVYDLQSWRIKAHEFYKGKTIQGESCGLFQYYVLGRLYSIYINWRTKRDNMRRLSRRRQKESPTIPTGEPNEIGQIEAKQKEQVIDPPTSEDRTG